MNAWSVALKDFKVILHDRGSLVISFIVPIAFILAFSLPRLVASSGPEEIVVPVVNPDPGDAAAQEFVATLSGIDGLDVREVGAEKAYSDLRDGNVRWLVEVPADFGTMSLEHEVTVRLVTRPDADPGTVDSISRVLQGVAKEMALKYQLLASFEQIDDMLKAAPAEYQVLTAETYTTQAEKQMERSRANPLVHVEQTYAVREEKQAVYGEANVTVPGFAVLFVFLTAQLTAQSVVQEKRAGTFRRLMASPLPRSSLLLGKMVPNFVVAFLQVVFIFATAMIVLPILGLERLTLGRDPVALVVLTALVALCSTGLGLLIAAVARTETQSGALSAVVLWVLGALGGSLFPTFLMSGPMKTVSSLTPHAWALTAYNTLLVYSGGLGDILPQLGVLAGFTAAFTLIGLRRFRYE